VLVVPVLRMMGAVAAGRAAGCSRRAVERAIRERGASLPRQATQARLLQAAADWARTQSGVTAPPADLGCLYSFLNRELRVAPGRTCVCGCGRELSAGQQLWWSEACRKRAARCAGRATDNAEVRHPARNSG
jgi:hypothetical protein